MTIPNHNLHLSVFPPAQRAIWPRLGEIPDAFVLVGGTALALQLGHRPSVDYDFFSNARFDGGKFFRTAPLFRDCSFVKKYTNQFDLGFRVAGAQKPATLSLIGGYNLNRVKPPIKADNGITIASTEDIFGMKCASVQDRTSYKDYLDIATILTSTQQFSLWLETSRKPQIDGDVWLVH